jgi:hypothetical protein
MAACFLYEHLFVDSIISMIKHPAGKKGSTKGIQDAVISRFPVILTGWREDYC